eukprot:COSAG02_NODE_31599_length_530_cov_3.401392_1_plen_106_part_10
MGERGRRVASLDRCVLANPTKGSSPHSRVSTPPSVLACPTARHARNSVVPTPRPPPPPYRAPASVSDAPSHVLVGVRWQKWSLLGQGELTKACQITLEDVRRQCAD